MDSHGKGLAVLFHRTPGNGDRRDSGDVRVDGVDVVEIHRDGVEAGADLECGARRGRAEKDVALRECGVEFLLDQPSDL